MRQIKKSDLLSVLSAVKINCYADLRVRMQKMPRARRGFSKAKRQAAHQVSQVWRGAGAEDYSAGNTVQGPRVVRYRFRSKENEKREVRIRVGKGVKA